MSRVDGPSRTDDDNDDDDDKDDRLPMMVHISKRGITCKIKRSNWSKGEIFSFFFVTTTTAKDEVPPPALNWW